ncbi:MAG: hypothetical protein IPK13_01755 [Deltaproteobacteria bacterium]|nr:hypothetical protein [Deltaproteobacteria bacterium]
MTNFSPLLIALVAIALGGVAFAVHLWRQLQARESDITRQNQLIEDRQSQLERWRQDDKSRRDELETLRTQLQEAKAKLRRHKEAAQQSGGGSGGGKKRREDAGARSAAQEPNKNVGPIVHVSNQALSEQYELKLESARNALAATERQLETARRDSVQLREQLKKAQARQEQAERAAVESQTGTDSQTKPGMEGHPQEASVAERGAPASGAKVTTADNDPAQVVTLLRAELDEVRRQAAQQVKKIEKQRTEAEHRARAATKRAASNHALYQVIKGQLELTEDRLALLKQRYEGARSPAEIEAALRKDRKKERRAARALEPKPASTDSTDSRDSKESTPADTPEVDTPDIETRAVDTPDIETRAVDTPDIETRAVDTPDIETRAVDTPDIETRAVDTPEVEAREVETAIEPIEAPASIETARHVESTRSTPPQVS